MTSPFDNLVKISKGGLKTESPSQAEIDGLIRSAQRKLLDARTPTLGLESAFDLAYNAAHAFALAALRWHRRPGTSSELMATRVRLNDWAGLVEDEQRTRIAAFIW